MVVTVKLSTPLIKTTGGEREIDVNSNTIAEMISSLKAQFPALVETICDADGNLKNIVTVYLNDKDIRFLEGLNTKFIDGDEVFIIPTIAGG